MLREGLGRVGEAEVVEPRIPTSAAEWQSLTAEELNPILLAMAFANEIRAVVDQGDARSPELERLEPDPRTTFSRALAEVG